MAMTPAQCLEHAKQWDARAEKFAHNPRVASAMTARATTLRSKANMNTSAAGTWPRPNSGKERDREASV